MKRDTHNWLECLNKPVRNHLTTSNLIGCAVINVLMFALCFALFVTSQLCDLFSFW